VSPVEPTHNVTLNAYALSSDSTVKLLRSAKCNWSIGKINCGGRSDFFSTATSSKVNCFAHPETMSGHQEDQGCVTLAPPALAGCADEFAKLGLPFIGPPYRATFGRHRANRGTQDC